MNVLGAIISIPVLLVLGTVAFVVLVVCTLLWPVVEGVAFVRRLVQC